MDNNGDSAFKRNSNVADLVPEAVNENLSDLLDFPVEVFTLKMLNLVPQVRVISQDFLEMLASNNIVTIRSVAAEHPDTSQEKLAEMLYDKSPVVGFAAFDNPSTPFEECLLKEHHIMPELPLNAMVTVSRRKKDFEKFMQKHGLNKEDVNSLPASWIIKSMVENIPNGLR